MCVFAPCKRQRTILNIEPFKEGVFKIIPAVEQMVVHFSVDGQLLHKESDEARKQQHRISVATGAEQTRNIM